MSGATGRGALPRQRRGELAAKMPGRCVGPSRSGWRWGRRWGTGASRGSGGRRRARFSIRKTRCKSAERLQDCQRSWVKRQAAETADAAGENEALGTPGTAGSIEAARDPKAVWVNGAVGDPEVVGPAGSVWVTRSGEEGADDSSPQGCERKGRPGTMGHESILELWLKVQAMRAASGCGVGSRVELHSLPAGEGPVERGIPGRASWVETSRGGVTGPWVRGQARAFPQVSGLSTTTGVGPGCEKASGSCGHRQAGKVPPVDAPGAMEELGYAPTPSPWERPQTVGQPEAMEVKMGCGTASDQWGRGQSVQVPEALAQEAVCGGTPGLWGRAQAAGNLGAVVAPRAVKEETTSVCVPGMWQRRQEVEDISSEALPGVWGMGQPVGVPCVTTKEETRCGDDPGFREKGRDMWVESGSGGDPGSWEATQTVEPSGPGVQEAGSQQVPQGLWGIEQAVGLPRTLGKETDCVSIPGLWGTGQLPGVSQAVVVPEARSEDTNYGGVPDLWERQQVLGTPPAEVVEETHSGNVLSLQERRQAMGEPEALVPGALGAAGPTDEEAGHGAVSCLCGTRHALGVSETVGMPKAAGVAWHRYSPVVVSTALGTPRSGRMPARVPAAVWVSGPVCQERSSRDVLKLWERAHTVRKPLDSGGTVAPEELWQTIGMSTAVGLSEPMVEETLSEGLLGLLGRRQTAGIPVAARLPMALGVPTASRVHGPQVVGESASGDGSGTWRRRQATEAPIAANGPGPVEGETGSEGVSGLWRRRHNGPFPETARVPVPLGRVGAVGVPVAGCVPASVWVTGSSGEAADVGISGLTAVSRQSTEGAEPSGEQTGGRGVLGMAGRDQAVGVSYTYARGARLWSCPRSVGEEAAHESVPQVSGIRMAVAVPPVSREEIGPSHFRDHPQQSGRRQP
ncbi:uncharacterized protein O8D03_003164 [Erethizon dorsatum]